MLSQVRFESFCKFATRQQDASPTAFALKPDIRAEARNGPFIGAARMLFSKAE